MSIKELICLSINFDTCMMLVLKLDSQECCCFVGVNCTQVVVQRAAFSVILPKSISETMEISHQQPIKYFIRRLLKELYIIYDSITTIINPHLRISRFREFVCSIHYFFSGTSQLLLCFLG